MSFLQEQGLQFQRNLLACLKWMSLGGELWTDSQQTLCMHEDGEVGILTVSPAGVRSIEHCGSALSWRLLRTHAKQMDPTDLRIMEMNIKITEAKTRSSQKG